MKTVQGVLIIAALPTIVTTTRMTMSSSGSSLLSIPSGAADVVKASSKPSSYKIGGNVDTLLSRKDNYCKLCPALYNEVKISTLLAQLDEAC